MEINAFCLDWHAKNSDAFQDILVKPLAPSASIKLITWDGKDLPTPVTNESDQPIIFCMLPPPQKLLESYKGRLVWIPMWDQAQTYDEQWWQKLPRNLRIVAFSNEVYKRASNAGLQALRIQYYLDPSSIKSASWDDGYTLFYWNRVGLAGPKFLSKLCNVLNIKKLLFKPTIDPRIQKNKYYDLPKKLDATEVVNIGITKNRRTFLLSIGEANLVLAPRLTEGVGMVFLEAMSRGCAVIGHDGPTMNEYIVHKKSGILLKSDYRPLRDQLIPVSHRPSTSSPFLLSDVQPWSKLARLDMQKLGNQARSDHAEGYAKWRSSINEYTDFVLNW